MGIVLAVCSLIILLDLSALNLEKPVCTQISFFGDSHSTLSIENSLILRRQNSSGFRYSEIVTFDQILTRMKVDNVILQRIARELKTYVVI